MGVRPKLVHFKQAIRACSNTDERVAGLSQEEAETIRAGAASAVSEIFNLIRRNDISPDGDCYAFATRSVGRTLVAAAFDWFSPMGLPSPDHC